MEQKAKEEKVDNVEKVEKVDKVDKKTAYFMKVCKHGVPHGFLCKGCEKIISIPEDAVIKPTEKKEDKPVEKKENK